jgi:hypothetical protein
MMEAAESDEEKSKLAGKFYSLAVTAPNLSDAARDKLLASSFDLLRMLPLGSCHLCKVELADDNWMIWGSDRYCKACGTLERYRALATVKAIQPNQ